MATFVIVHGAWGGGWGWRQTVGAPLRAAGHDVLTPTLTGLGERLHLATPDVDLDTHIRDIVNVLEYEDLHDVILVGHSYGGMVITGVADQVVERLSQLIYLDALVPHDGQALVDLVDQSAVVAWREQARTQGEGWRIPASPLPADTPAACRPWAGPRRAPQPLKTFTQPLRLRHGEAVALPRGYIYCNRPPGGVFEQFAERLRADKAWRYFELPTGHNVQYTMPRECAELLLRLV